MRVLLVEDDPLQREGYAVDWVDNGREAMAAARDHDFSVMVLDLGLPDVDGMKVLEAALRWPARPPALARPGAGRTDMAERQGQSEDGERQDSGSRRK